MTTGSSSEGRAGRTWRERVAVVGPAMVIMVASLVIAYQFIKPAPPRHIVLATGPEQGTYAYYGRLYRDRLQREGISVATESTRGSIQNIELLRDHRADIAFVQGGAADDIEAPHLRSLASLYLEPIWIFVRKDASIGRLSELRGRRVALDNKSRPAKSAYLTRAPRLGNTVLLLLNR